MTDGRVQIWEDKGGAQLSHSVLWPVSLACPKRDMDLFICPETAYQTSNWRLGWAPHANKDH